ncbi:threonine/serine dehydratase [Actinophytocola sp. NPDC049390]|uniref:threonine/serine dehydratase n=1 Tax=Actinophytocola sp. NPDC049390 TaxID=3363894 RepID=UPI0037B022C5
MDLDLDRIARAAREIDPVFLHTPQYVDDQLCTRLGTRVLTKVETLNPLRSFKGRGADFAIAALPAGSTVVCSSTGGNFGQAVGYAARRRGLRAEVFVPAGTSPVKLARMTATGAVVHEVDGDAKEAAKAVTGPGRVYLSDGLHPAIAEGAGSIGVELATESFDTVVVPVGDGALISGIACWVKEKRPGVRVVGVAAAAAPALVESWRQGAVVTVPQENAFAAGITISRPEPVAVTRLRALVDDMVLVTDDELRAAMALAAETLGVLLEPAGAAGLAAIPKLGTESVATVLTGANADVR